MVGEILPMRKALLVLALFLSACPAPPVLIDLLQYLGGNRSGEKHFQVSAGNYLLEQKLPGEQGYPVDFTQANVPTGYGASLEWALDITLKGVQVNGNLTVQLYLAPYEAQDPFKPEYKLGKPVEAQVTTGRKVSLSGSAALNRQQLSALGAKKLRLGAVVSGNLSVDESGTLTLFYEVTRAMLKVRWC